MDSIVMHDFALSEDEAADLVNGSLVFSCVPRAQSCVVSVGWVHWGPPPARSERAIGRATDAIMRSQT